jgi:serine/threonine protein kinase
MHHESINLIFFQVVKALSYLHQGRRIAHRDIKPHNILLMASDETLLTDFGTAKNLVDSEDSNRTTTGLQGTINYMSPEISRIMKRREVNEYDPFASDMWSLAVTIYETITFELPF